MARAGLPCLTAHPPMPGKTRTPSLEDICPVHFILHRLHGHAGQPRRYGGAAKGPGLL